jgi:8-oxo-dGTP pyrophosphatase MutT (NUDIX family)
MDAMIGAVALERIEARLARALAPPARPLVPFMIDDAIAGQVTPDRAERLAAFADVFRRDGAALRFAPRLNDAAERSEAVAGVTAQLAAEGALTAWRDELYAVAPGLGAPPWFLLERAAARYFGVPTHAAHVNGLVQAGSETLMWLARRSATKSIDPGLLDNLVGGGIAAGTSVPQTIVKEAWEEAGIAAGVAAGACAAGTLEIFREQPDGIQRETLHVFDLWLAPDFVPRNQDGEALDHRRVTLPQVAGLLAVERGPDAVTADASLVAFDCLKRLDRKRSAMPSGPER